VGGRLSLAHPLSLNLKKSPFSDLGLRMIQWRVVAAIPAHVAKHDLLLEPPWRLSRLLAVPRRGPQLGTLGTGPHPSPSHPRLLMGPNGAHRPPMRPTYILGISAYYHDSAACLLRDGSGNKIGRSRPRYTSRLLTYFAPGRGSVPRETPMEIRRWLLRMRYSAPHRAAVSYAREWGSRTDATRTG
jgi:hypothetical protein